MTNAYDPSARYRRNPREMAAEFRATDPTLNPQLRQAEMTMSPTLQAATTIGVPEVPTPAVERPFEDINLSDENVRISELQQQEAGAWQRAAEAAMQRQQQQQISQQGQQGQDYSGYRADGNLSAGRQRILNTAAQYGGTRYQLGGRTATGIDCSGLVMSVYNQLGFNIRSHSVSGQARSVPGVKTDVRNLRPGDLVVWNDNSHIAIYAGNGQIWDASRSRGTTLRNLWASPDKVYGLALRLPGDM